MEIKINKWSLAFSLLIVTILAFINWIYPHPILLIIVGSGMAINTVVAFQSATE